jgi:cell division transport system permease protein
VKPAERRRPRRGATRERGKPEQPVRRPRVRPQQAVRQVLPWRTRLGAWGRHHLQSFLATLMRFVHSPVSQLLTAAVIGVALALPSALYLAVENLGRIVGDLDSSGQISLFLEAEVSDTDARDLAERLDHNPDIAEIAVITRAEALAELRRYAGFSEAVDVLGENPLPPLLIVRPAMTDRPAAVATLVADLEALDEVDMAQLDMQWVRRLLAIMAIAERLVLLLAIVLGVAVLVVVGNTIRLDIQNRREEIEVVKLIGGTDAFIRRPFLYNGLWYGIVGGGLGWILVEVGRILLAGPVRQLAGLYDSGFAIEGLGLHGLGALVGIAAVLGLVGSWLAVARHLRRIEPA